MRRAGFLCGVWVCLMGCAGGGSTSSTSSGGQDTPPQAVFGGSATADQWNALWMARGNTVTDAALGAVLVVPTEGATLSVTQPETLVWTSLLQPVAVHWLAFEFPANTPVLHVVTTGSSWVPDADNWETLAASAGAELRVVVTSVRFENDQLVDAPVRSAGVRRFHIQ